MRKILIIAALGLSACGAQAPMVRDGDLKRAAQDGGYTNVTIMPTRTHCGKGGATSKAKSFIGTKDGVKYLGKVCYWKANRQAKFRIDIINTLPN